MTRVRVLSDLHLEFGPMSLEPIGEDVLILAGDVDLGARGAERGAAYARDNRLPVIYIAGNHEFYRQRPMHDLRRQLSYFQNANPWFYYLDQAHGSSSCTIGGVTFIGATLWTDFKLDGTEDESMLIARRTINDYYLITYDGEPSLFTPELSAHEHLRDLAGLATMANFYRGRKLVVVTHHAPSRRSIISGYRDSPLNPAYASNLDPFVENSAAVLWVHGHMHASLDYTIGETRVVCNPRGYHPHALNQSFDPNLVIEV